MSEEMGVLEIYREWRKGCSCAKSPDEPEYCSACTRGALEAIFAIPEYHTSRRELRARAEIILRMIRAKREAGFPRECDFFRDVWPVALDAMRRTGCIAADGVRTVNKPTEEDSE